MENNLFSTMFCNTNTINHQIISSFNEVYWIDLKDSFTETPFFFDSYTTFNGILHWFLQLKYSWWCPALGSGGGRRCPPGPCCPDTQNVYVFHLNWISIIFLCWQLHPARWPAALRSPGEWRLVNTTVGRNSKVGSLVLYLEAGEDRRAPGGRPGH